MRPVWPPRISYSIDTRAATRTSRLDTGDCPTREFRPMYQNSASNPSPPTISYSLCPSGSKHCAYWCLCFVCLGNIIDDYSGKTRTLKCKSHLADWMHNVNMNHELCQLSTMSTMLVMKSTRKYSCPNVFTYCTVFTQQDVRCSRNASQFASIVTNVVNAVWIFNWIIVVDCCCNWVCAHVHSFTWFVN